MTVTIPASAGAGGVSGGSWLDRSRREGCSLRMGTGTVGARLKDSAGPLGTLVPVLPARWAGGVVDDSPEAVSVVRCYFVVQTTLTSDDAALASIYVLAF